MEEKELVLIDKVLEESSSQKDRQDIDNTKNLNLINFIEKQINKVNAKDTLRNSVLDKLKQKVNSQNEELTPVELIKLLEILEKTDNEMTSIIFENIKEAGNKSHQDKDSEEINFTAEDFSIIKKLVKYIDLLDKTEGN